MDQGRQKRDVHLYDDMLPLPHPVSKKHPSMARMNRAAQFAPFAALTGYEDAVRESARLTDQRQELEEDSRELLDEELQKICVHTETSQCDSDLFCAGSEKGRRQLRDLYREAETDRPLHAAACF